jgi:hypothetical protein
MTTPTQEVTEDLLRMGISDEHVLDIGDLLGTVEPSLDIEMAREAQIDTFRPQPLLGETELIEEQSRDMSLIQNMMDLGLSPGLPARPSAMDIGKRNSLLQETTNVGDA